MVQTINNAGNNTVGASNTGQTNTFTVTNPSDTASSAALINVTVGGTSAADAFQTYTIAGTTNWSEGIDNSDSDKYKLSASTALGTSDVISATTAGAVSCVLGNFDTTRSASGADVSVTASNTSNTASSNATVYATVAGTSAGDAQVQYAVSGTTTWTTGIDNSASDAYVIAASSALGTTNVMSMAVAGGVSCVLGNFDTTRSASGADVSVTASNTSNTASSNATVYATVAGTSAGDAQVQFAVSGTTTWTHGIDNSASDAFVLAASTALGTTNVMSASTAGEVIWPLQPAFLAYVNTTIPNVTGDGTLYTIIYDTEVYDQNSDFNLGTSTFTAPVTGKYLFNLAVRLGGAATLSSTIVNISTSNRIYRTALMDVNGTAATGAATMSVLADMDAADTAIFQVQATDGSGKIDDITGAIGGTDLVNFISGKLDC